MRAAAHWIPCSVRLPFFHFFNKIHYRTVIETLLKIWFIYEESRRTVKKRKGKTFDVRTA